MSNLGSTEVARSAVEASLVHRLSMGCGESLTVLNGATAGDAVAAMRRLRSDAARAGRLALARAADPAVRP